MLEASAVATGIPSLWSAVNSWFTPAVLFLLLNLMIATIALTSSLTPTTPPPHHMHAFPQENHHHQEQHHQEEDEEQEQAHPTITTKQSSSISILDRVKSLDLFSPRKSLQKQGPSSPLIPLEEVNGETSAVPIDPFEKQGLGHTESPSTARKFEAFDLYGYLPREPAPEIPQESNPAHYIFETTHTQEVLVSAGRDGKREEEGEEEDGEADEKEEEEEEETREGDGSAEEIEREAPNLLLQRRIWRSESLNAKFSFSNLREGEGRVGGGLEEGDMVEAVEKRRPSTVRERKGKLGGGGGAGGDEEVDARADDFINRFKQQLKLQRMDSLARQKDVTMISKVRSF